METDTDSILIDSNVLIYASIPTAQFHEAALEALDRIESEQCSAWISPQVLREYLVHMTRQEVLVDRTVAELIQQVGRLIGHYSIAYDNKTVVGKLLELIARFRPQGKQLHDANIVATCIGYKIPRLLTQNRADFERYASLLEIETL